MRQAEKKIKGDKKMANIIKFEEKYSEQVYNLFMNVRDEEDFFKEFSYEEFCGHLFRSRAFNEEGTFVALEGEEVVGFASSMVRPSDDGNEKASVISNGSFCKLKSILLFRSRRLQYLIPDPEDKCEPFQFDSYLPFLQALDILLRPTASHLQ